MGFPLLWKQKIQDVANATFLCSAGILEQSMRAGNRVRTETVNLSRAMGTIGTKQAQGCRTGPPAYVCSLATQFQTRFLEPIPRPIAGLKFSTQGYRSCPPGYKGWGIDSFEPIPGLLRSLKIPSQEIDSPSFRDDGIYCLPLFKIDFMIIRSNGRKMFKREREKIQAFSNIQKGKLNLKSKK